MLVPFLLMFLSPLTAAAIVCAFPDEVKDSYGCVPFAYFAAAKNCDIPAGACFTLQVAEERVVQKQVQVSLYGKGATEAKAREVCRGLQTKKAFGPTCVVGKVVPSIEPLRTEVEVVAVELR